MSELNPQGSKKQKSSIPFLYWVVLFCFLLVVFRVNDYGASIDEPLFYDYSDETITVYKKAILNQPFEEVYTYPFFQIYGPAYLILGHFTVQVLKPILPFLDRFNLWHLANFITFLAGVVLIYQISSKFASKMAAQFAALLFLTQPLLWGQGVINLKDMPFLVFFSGFYVYWHGNDRPAGNAAPS